jgi:serine/threonine protein kinase
MGDASSFNPKPGIATVNAGEMEAAEAANLAIQQRYSKDKKVGEGTYAVVYLGHQLDSNRKIAIKKARAAGAIGRGV